MERAGYMEAARSRAHAKQTSHRHSNGRQARHINSGRLLRRHLAGFYTAVDTLARCSARRLDVRSAWQRVVSLWLRNQPGDAEQQSSRHRGADSRHSIAWKQDLSRPRPDYELTCELFLAALESDPSATTPSSMQVDEPGNGNRRPSVCARVNRGEQFNTRFIPKSLVLSALRTTAGALEIPCHFCKLKKRNDTCEKNLILM